MMQNRRSFLAGTMCISTISAGCLSFASSSSPKVEMRARFGGSHPQAVFSDSDDRWDNSPVTADVFEDPDTATSALNIEDELLRRNYLDFDPNTEFLAVFSSTLGVRHENYCPNVEATDHRIVFELPIGDWPAEREPPHEYLIVLTRWERNGNDPPSYATVNIIHPDKSSQTRTCPHMREG